MQSILRQSFGSHHCDIASPRANWSIHNDHISCGDLAFAQRFYPKIESISGHGVKPCGDLIDFPGLFFYTMLRDPLSRCASHYQHQVLNNQKHVTFEQWIEDPKYQNFQVRKIAGSDDLDAAKEILKNQISFVGLVERFDDSLLMLKARLGSRRSELDLDYQRQNVASSSLIRSKVMTNGLDSKLLREANGSDLELYSWVIDELYPRQICEYEESLFRNTSEVEQLLPLRRHRRSNQLELRIRRGLYKAALRASRRL